MDLLLDWLYYEPVGHMVEALKVSRGLTSKNPGLRVTVLINSDAPLTLADACPWVERVIPIDLEEVVAWVRERKLESDPLVRRRLSELAVEVLEIEMHALRVLDAMLKGRPAVVEAAANKVAHTVTCQNIARAAFSFGSPEALLEEARVGALWRQSLWETIGGGTTEVMLGVVARHGLGLGARR